MPAELRTCRCPRARVPQSCLRMPPYTGLETRRSVSQVQMLARVLIIRALEDDPRTTRAHREPPFASRLLRPSLPFELRPDPHLPVASSDTRSAAKRMVTSNAVSLIAVRQRMVTRHCLQQDGRLRRKVRIPFEVTEAGAQCRQRRAGQCVVGDCSDGCHFGPERFCGRSIEVLHGEVGDLHPVAFGHRSALRGETVQSSSVGLAGEFEESVHVSCGIPSRPPRRRSGPPRLPRSCESGLLGHHIICRRQSCRNGGSSKTWIWMHM